MRRALGVAVLVVLAANLAPARSLADDGPPKPSPTPRPAVIQTFTPEQYAQAQAIAQATSLSVRIDAERALAAAERAFVDKRLAQLRTERDRIVGQIADLEVEVVQRQGGLDPLPPPP